MCYILQDMEYNTDILYITSYVIYYRICQLSGEFRDWTLLLGKKRQRLRLFTKVAKLMLRANGKTTGLHLLSQRYVISARNYLTID